MPKNSTDLSAIESSNVVVQNPFTPDSDIADAGLTTIDPEKRSESAPEIYGSDARTPQKSPKLSEQKLEKAARSAERQRLMRTIRNCAEKLAKVPSQFDLGEMTGITRHEIQKHFANYGLALRACGLEEAGARQDVETLFGDWARITRALGRTPTAGEYSMRSQFGEHPLRRRFGGWRAATQGMLLYAKEKGRENELTGTTQAGAEEKYLSDTAMSDECMSRLALNLLPYGESLNPLPMAHGPRNETGVVFAFGMLAKELGFVILSMQTAYPDCEALRRVEPGWWQRVRIEIEYQSFNFVKHRHDPLGCDLIVCWEHNWPECPVEVLELRKVVNRVIG